MKFSQDLHKKDLAQNPQDLFARIFENQLKWAPRGCASAAGDIKIRTERQQERSDTDKVTRGLREHVLECQQILRAPWKINIENVNARGTEERLLCEIIIMHQIKNDDGFTKREFGAYQNIIKFHQILRWARNMTSKSACNFDPCLPTF